MTLAIGQDQPTKEAVHAALSAWGRQDGNPSPLADLLLAQQTAAAQAMTTDIAAAHLLETAVAQLAQERPVYHQILTQRFFEGRPGHVVARQLSVADGHLWRLQGEAILRLTELLQAQESAAQSARLARFAGRLEAATYAQFIGREAQLASLETQLGQLGPPWFIAVEGIGGIGKTSLADVLARRLLAQGYWHNFAWITVTRRNFNGGGAIQAATSASLTTESLVDELTQQLLGGEMDTQHLVYPQKQALLQERLRQRPHLIVVDNLESVQDVESMLAGARSLCNPTKFLLTTRHRRFQDADVFHFPVPELERQDALALLRQEATVRNVPDLAAASDAELQPIWATVGGNPLALRLVVGQLHTHTLGHVLDELRQPQGGTAANIYAYIYRQAWLDLDESARQVLLLMPLVVDSGGGFDYLVEMGRVGGISPAQISDGLEALVSRNLVDSRGDLHQRRYSIHSLTKTFLQQQVLGWTHGE